MLTTDGLVLGFMEPSNKIPDPYIHKPDHYAVCGKFSRAKKLAYILNTYFLPGPKLCNYFPYYRNNLSQLASVWILVNSKEVFQKTDVPLIIGPWLIFGLDCGLQLWTQLDDARTWTNTFQRTKYDFK